MNELLTIEEVKEYLKVSRSTLWRLRNKKQFPKAIKLTESLLRFKKADLLEYVDRNSSTTKL